jgi:hypothetical protein
MLETIILRLAALLAAIAIADSQSTAVSCPDSSFGKYIETLERSNEEVTASITNIIINVPLGTATATNDTFLYNSLTSSFNISSSPETFTSFSNAFNEIKRAYFAACHGTPEERPTIDSAPTLLSEFLTLLDNTTDIDRIRELFGQLSCLQNFTQTPQTRRKRQAANATIETNVQRCLNTVNNIASLYDCIDMMSSKCIFNVIQCAFLSKTQGPTIRKRNCLGFVIDTTGSMEEEIVHARDVVFRFIQREQDITTLCYVLTAFNDHGNNSGWTDLGNLDLYKIYDASYFSNVTGTKPSFTVKDRNGTGVTVGGINNLLTDISSLTVDGGGDCPEYGMTGIMQALEFINTIDVPEVIALGKHNLIVLTDASAKDDSLYQTVINRATGSGNADVTVHFFFSGTGCSGSFGHYDDIRNATGGHSVTQIDASAFEQFVSFVRSSSSSATGKRNTDDCQDFTISHFVTSFSALFQTTQSSITITKPDGTDETITTVANNFAVYDVTNPQTGQWRACITPGSTLQLTLTTATDIGLTVNYLRRLESGDLLPTSELPYACDNRNFTVTFPMLSKVSLNHSLYLDIVDNNGNILESSELLECSGLLSGAATLPTGLVQYQLRGHDNSTTPFAHIIPNSQITFALPQLDISLISSPIVLNKESTATVGLSIKNIKNGPQMLSITVTSIATTHVELTASYINQPLNLFNQENVEFTFNLTASASITPGQELEWTINIVDSCTNSVTSKNFTAMIIPAIEMNVTQSTRTSITVQWIAPSVFNNITGYTLTFDLSNGTITKVIVDSQTLEYELTQLSPYQLVSVTIAASSDNGENIAALTTPIQALTNEAEPGPVSQVSTAPHSSTSIQLTWSRPLITNGIILYYEVLVRNGSSIIHNNTYSPTVFNAVINDLEPFRRYTAIVRGATSAGNGKPIRLRFYLTEGSPVKAPQYHSHVVISPTSITLQWIPVSIEDARGFITEYTIRIQSSVSTKVHKTSKNVTTLTVREVPAFARLSVSFSASTSMGEGVLSTPKIIYIVTGVPSSPRAFSGSALNATSVELSWNDPEFIRGEIFNYRLYYKKSGQNEIEKAMMTPSGRNTTTIINLTSADTYNFKIGAVNFAGHGDNSTEISVTLPLNSSAIAAAITVPIIIIIIAVLGLVIIVGVIVFIVYQLKGEKRSENLKAEVEMSDKEKITQDNEKGAI